MSDGTAIEWCTRPGTKPATWNPVTGCSRVHAGCDHCYAVTMTHRLEAMGQAKYAGLTVLNPKGDRHFNGKVRTVGADAEKPLKWRMPRTVFVNSMSDLFHPSVPQTFTQRLFGVMNECARHTFIILTKRPQLAADLAHLFDWSPNIWLLTSVSDQGTADAMIPHLLRCPAKVRGVSYEPALGPINFSKIPDEWDRPSGHGSPTLLGDLDWVIFGGESGSDRHCNLAWADEALAQCRQAGVPFYMKQAGSKPFYARETLSYQDRKGADPSEWPAHLRVREFPRTEAHT